jgi:hypothetical protein
LFKIEGLDELTKQLDDAQKALDALDGELGTVSFDPNDPASIEAAIQSVETTIDERLGRYADNLIVAPVVESMKSQYRETILERAALARLKGSAD